MSSQNVLQLIYSLAELRALAKKLGLASTGNKEQLSARIWLYNKQQPLGEPPEPKAFQQKIVQVKAPKHIPEPMPPEK